MNWIRSAGLALGEKPPHIRVYGAIAIVAGIIVIGSEAIGSVSRLSAKRVAQLGGPAIVLVGFRLTRKGLWTCLRNLIRQWWESGTTG